MKIYVVADKPSIAFAHGRRLYFDLEKAKEMRKVLNRLHCEEHEPEWKIYEVSVRIKK